MGWIDHGNSLYPDKAKIFMRDQIENLKLWRNSLQNQIAINWKTEEDNAEEQIRFLLDSKSFQKDGILSSNDFEKLFPTKTTFKSWALLT
jgi:hypothetical protein